MEVDPAKEWNDPVQQPNLKNIADSATKQKWTAATSRRIKILKQSYETEARYLVSFTLTIQKLT